MDCKSVLHMREATRLNPKESDPKNLVGLPLKRQRPAPGALYIPFLVPKKDEKTVKTAVYFQNKRKKN